MKKTKVRVYGSGVSGRLMAYRFLERGCDVEVVDPINKPILQTKETELGPVELAANSILFNASVRDLLEDLCLDYKFYNSVGKNKYFFVDGECRKWPLTFLNTIKSLPFVYKVIKKKNKLKPHSNETLKDWSKKFMNSSLYENVFKLGLQGIYGYDVDELSASLTVSNFLKPKKRSKLPKGSVSFPKGMGQFTEALKIHLTENGVSFSNKPEKILDPDIQIVSTPAHSLPECVDKEMKHNISSVKYKSISTVTLFFEEKSRLPIKGFGCVFKEGEGVLGLLLNSDIYENRAKVGYVSETWILDGRKCKTKEESLDSIFKMRKNIMKNDSHPVSSHHCYWDKAFPAYDLTLESVLKDLSRNNSSQGIYFFSNWTGQLGIGRMIESSITFSDEVLNTNRVGVV